MGAIDSKEISQKNYSTYNHQVYIFWANLGGNKSYVFKKWGIVQKNKKLSEQK